MNKEKWVILFIYLVVIIAACVALTSCNPVKKVILNEKYYKQVTDKFVSEGGCVNDTIIQSKSDTLITFDTLYGIEYVNDTVLVNDVKTVVRTEYKTVVQKVIIRDTINNVVTDNSRINLLNGKLIVSNTINKDLSDKVKKERKRGNKWSLRFWFLFMVVSIYIARKPIWRGLKAIISPIKL